MRTSQPLTLIGDVSAGILAAAQTELKTGSITGTSVVPGFSDGRSVVALRRTPKSPRDRIWFDADMIDCIDTPVYDAWPAMRQLVNEVVSLTNATQLGMITLATLNPGAKIHQHFDHGVYYDHYRRIHIALQTNSNAWLCSGDDRQNLKVGEVWELDNLLTHYAVNYGYGKRVHIIIDLI